MHPLGRCCQNAKTSEENFSHPTGNLKSADARAVHALCLAEAPVPRSFVVGTAIGCGMDVANQTGVGVSKPRECSMGQMSWMVSVVAAIAVIFGASRFAGESAEPEQVGFETATAEPEVGDAESFFVGSPGSALASAAFGLEALQPETYNGEIVLDIIDASPLERAEKRRLTASLEAAEAGRAHLPSVLQEVRLSLAVE